MSEKKKTSVELTDARALRALAHPTRLKLVGLLRLEGAMTATQAGLRLGESPASCSFHLRQLAKWGLVEEAGGGRGRERPWQATAESTQWTVNSPELSEPAAALGAVIVRMQAERILEAFAALPEEPVEWQQAHQLGDTMLSLTPAELDELGNDLWELLNTYRSRTPKPDARQVEVFYAALPRPEGKP